MNVLSEKWHSIICCISSSAVSVPAMQEITEIIRVWSELAVAGKRIRLLVELCSGCVSYLRNVREFRPRAPTKGSALGSRPIVLCCA